MSYAHACQSGMHLDDRYVDLMVDLLLPGGPLHLTVDSCQERLRHGHRSGSGAVEGVGKPRYTKYSLNRLGVD